MNRTRIGIVIGVLVVFAAAGGYLIFGGHQAPSEHRTFDVTVTGARAMSPSHLSAHQNDTITINLKSDIDGEVHLHGYDLHFDTRAGETVSHTFKAGTTCTCDIEWESTGTPLGTLVVSP
ncbi:hypothetical protein EPN29_01345 [bacterium]|nr:MAG: hypothetical protein EPN29_01345 [bacterium]